MKKILLLTSIFGLNMLMAALKPYQSRPNPKPTQAAKNKAAAKRKVANELLFDKSEYQKIKKLDPVAIKVLSADAIGDGFVYTVYTLVPQENATSGKYELETQKAKIIDEASFNDNWFGDILDSYINKNDDEMQEKVINDSL